MSTRETLLLPLSDVLCEVIMSEQPKEKLKHGGKVRLMPIPGRRRSLKEAMESINRRFPKTLSKLAK
jgi:hypothetical protein